MIGRRRSWLWAVALAACFDDPPASEDDGAPTTAADDGGAEATTGDGDGDGGPADDDGVDETAAGPTVTVSGTVVESWIAPMNPIEGTQVQLVGMPGLSSVTDAEGRFLLSGVPAGLVSYLAVAPSSVYLGSVAGVDVPFVDVEGVTLSRFRRLDVEMQLEALQMMNPDVAYDDARGAVVVVSSHPNTEVSLDPMPPAGSYYALDGMGQPVLDATSSTFLVPSVVFFNLEVGDVGIVEVDASHPMRVCDVPLPSPPIRADHVSFVGVSCA